MADDSEWLVRLQRGEAAAFEHVYAQHRREVYAFLVRLSGRPDVAADLSQETWLRLARHARRLRPDTRVRAWLFTVARNLHTSYRRWAWLDATRALAPAWTAAAPVSPHEELAARRTHERLERALRDLPAADREVILLVAVHGLEPAEAAEVLGVEPEALRQRLSRARRRLAERAGLEGDS